MKILFISDIHGITMNLDYIRNLDDKERFDKIVVLGDLYYAGPSYSQMFKIDSVGVSKFLASFSDRIICMRGNCDSDVDIKVTDFPICNDLSLIMVDDINIYLTHGNKYNKFNSHKFNNSILVYGHEHVPYIEKLSDMVYICVGSISLPRNNSKPSYMIYENKKFVIYSIDGCVVDEISID